MTGKADGVPHTDFAHLEQHDKQLVRLGMLAERYFPEDPNTSILKLRQLTELLAQLVATRVGIYTSREEAQYDLLRRLQDQGILPREVAQLFGEVRRSGNAASHAIAGDHRTALAVLKITWQLGIWFHRTFASASFKSGPFIPPSAPVVTRPVYLSDKVLRLVVRSELKQWLLFALQSPDGRKQIETLSSGNQLSMRNLSQANLRSIRVPMPPSDEREEIVRRVEAVVHQIRELEGRYENLRRLVSQLGPSCLAKAFRGELVPQDPGDEPASELLARIRNGNGAPGGPPKADRAKVARRRSRSKTNDVDDRP